MSCIINGSAGLTTNSGAVYNGISSGTAVSASGTSVDFTSIPSWVKRITVMFSSVSTNGTSEMIIQLGTSGGIQATGYLGTSSVMASSVLTTNYSTGFMQFTNNNGATESKQGAVTISLLDAASGIWTCFGNIGTSSTARTSVLCGSKTLSGVLDRIRITTVNGTDSFDAGSINILYE